MDKFNTKFRKLDKKLIVVYSGGKVDLPEDVQKKVDGYWEELQSSGKKLWRGEGYHITGMTEDGKSIRVELALSDYAHYIYSRYNEVPKKYAFKNIHTSCLIETSDGYMVFGVMGKETAIAGNVQCVGGGIDNDDLKGKKFDLRHNIIKELKEEMAVDVHDKKMTRSLRLEYIKYNKKLNTVAAIFILKLKITSDEFRKRYERFEKKLAKKGVLPEFGEVIYLKKDKKEVENFIRSKTQPDHYLKYLLRERINA